MKLWFIFALILHISCIFGKRELKLVHTILRHGERIPLANYPRDVVDESYWDLPYGALTENGIKQVYQQGSRLRKRYVDDFKFISPKYNEVGALSTSVERCLLSAGSFLSGLFSQKKIDDEDWSLNWTPIPVKTDYFGSDKIWTEYKACKRIKNLTNIRLSAFLPSLQEKYQTFLEYVATHTGIPNLTLFEIVYLHNIISVEKYFNISQKSWLTDTTYIQMENLTRQMWDVYDGASGFGLDEDSELIKLRGGPLFKFVMDNFDKTITTNSFPVQHYGGYSHLKTNKLYPKKFYLLSCHDISILSILRLLRIREITFEPNDSPFPQFAAMLVFELYKNGDSYEVDLLYSKNSQSELKKIRIIGCGQDTNYSCNLETLRLLTQSYTPVDVERECSDQNIS